MEKRFVVITEIFYDGEKISRHRIEKFLLERGERNQIIKTLYLELENQKVGSMDIYSKISVQLKEKFGLSLSERSIMRAIKKV